MSNKIVLDLSCDCVGGYECASSIATNGSDPICDAKRKKVYRLFGGRKSLHLTWTSRTNDRVPGAAMLARCPDNRVARFDRVAPFTL